MIDLFTFPLTYPFSQSGMGGVCYKRSIVIAMPEPDPDPPRPASVERTRSGAWLVKGMGPTRRYSTKGLACRAARARAS